MTYSKDFFVNQINLNFAQRAFNWTSFNPEKRGESVRNDFSLYMIEDLEQIKKFAPDSWESEFEAYNKKALEFFNNWLSAHSRCASSAITGPAKFPTQRMQKYNTWEHNAFQKFLSFRIKAKKGIKKRNKKSIDPLIKAKKDLSQRLEMQERMKEANKILRKKGLQRIDQFEQLQKIGFSDSLINNLFVPDWSGRIGFAPFQFSNNLANIKRLENRVNELEKKELAKSENDSKIFTCEFLEVVKNFSDDRLQLLFHEKPSDKIRTILKRNAFRWSPKNNAWQRQLTNNSIYVFEKIVLPELKNEFNF